MKDIEDVAAAVLGESGVSSRELRIAVESYAAGLGGLENEADIPDDLRDWVNKVALHAYRTTDGDVEKLRSSGYSEDEIFELTIAAAHGAARARLERALAVLSEDIGSSDEA